MRKPGVSVIDAQGEEGILDDTAQSAAPDEAVIRLASGERVRVPNAILMASRDGSFRLDGTFHELQRSSLPDDDRCTGESVHEEIIPVVEEVVRVEKRARETGRVRISKHVTERVETVDEPLLREEVDIERVPINRILEEPVGIRHEGDVMIIPVCEEQLVVRKQFVLKEELRVTRRSATHHEPQDLSLRSETVQIQRISPGEGPKEEMG